MGLLYSNYETNPTTNVKVNAVSGTLVKTLRKSFFQKFHINSRMAEYAFDSYKPTLDNPNYSNCKEIIVLQIMLCGDNELLVEVIYKKDYEEMFNIENEAKESK